MLFNSPLKVGGKILMDKIGADRNYYLYIVCPMSCMSHA